MSHTVVNFLDIEFSQVADSRGMVHLSAAVSGQEDQGITLSFQGRLLDEDEIPAFCDAMSEIFDMVESRRPRKPAIKLVVSRDASFTP